MIDLILTLSNCELATKNTFQFLHQARNPILDFFISWLIWSMYTRISGVGAFLATSSSVEVSTHVIFVVLYSLMSKECVDTFEIKVMLLPKKEVHFSCKGIITRCTRYMIAWITRSIWRWFLMKSLKSLYYFAANARRLKFKIIHRITHVVSVSHILQMKFFIIHIIHCPMSVSNSGFHQREQQ